CSWPQSMTAPSSDTVTATPSHTRRRCTKALTSSTLDAAKTPSAPPSKRSVAAATPATSGASGRPRCPSAADSTRASPSKWRARSKTCVACSTICPPLPDCRRHHAGRSEEHTSELQSRENIVCRLLLEKKKRDDDVR